MRWRSIRLLEVWWLSLWGVRRLTDRARPDRAPIYVILGNLSAHKGDMIRRWAKKNRAELCFTSTYASWVNPIETHLGPVRQCTIANSHHRKGPARLPAPAQSEMPATPTSSPPNAGSAPASGREGHPLGRTPTRRGCLTEPVRLWGHSMCSMSFRYGQGSDDTGNGRHCRDGAPYH